MECLLPPGSKVALPANGIDEMGVLQDTVGGKRGWKGLKGVASGAGSLSLSGIYFVRGVVAVQLEVNC